MNERKREREGERKLIEDSKQEIAMTFYALKKRRKRTN